MHGYTPEFVPPTTRQVVLGALGYAAGALVFALATLALIWGAEIVDALTVGPV